MRNSEWKCTAFGQDTCVVPKESIVPSRTFFISTFIMVYLLAIHCDRACDYKIVLRAEVERELRPEQPAEGQILEYESRLFYFRIPADPALHSIAVDLSLGANTMSKVRMYVVPVRESGTVPSSQSPIRPVPSWQGLSVRVYRDEDSRFFCTNCTYRVLVTSTVDTNYKLSYSAVPRVSVLAEQNVNVFEVVRYNETNCHSYEVQDITSTLEVGLTVFSGNPDIYVNPRALAEPLDRFAFSSKGGIDEVLSVTPEQRRSAGALTGLYVICIRGMMTSAYNLMVRTASETALSHIPMASGLTRTMDVKKDEIKTFEYVIDPAISRHRTNVSFALASITGNADLYVKYCTVSTPTQRCTITKLSMNEPDVMRSMQTSSMDSIATMFNPDTCSSGFRCSYVIAVHGVVDSRFSLSVLGEERVEMLLREGVPMMGHVGLRQFKYFVFPIEDPRTRLIKIQLSSVNGDSDLYVSRVNPFCGCLMSERGSSLENFLTDTVVFDSARDGNLNATYHLSVYGFTDSTFTIYYSTTGPSGASKAIRLYDGQSLSGAINDTSEGIDGMLYQFAVSFPPGASRDIQVTVSPMSGAYRMFVGADFVPSPENHTWSADASQLSIPVSDPYYRSRGTYYVLVCKAFRGNRIPHVFSVKYSTGVFLSTIVEGQPELGNVTRGQPVHYRYSVANFTGEVTVTVTPLSGDPDLYISINSSNKMPSIGHSDYVSASIGADAIRLQLTELQRKSPKECSENARVSGQCAIYIAVTCASEECFFVLQVSHSFVPLVRIMEGIPQFGTTSAGQPQFYTFSPSETNESAIVTVYPKRGNVRAYAKVVPNSLFAHDTKKGLPTPIEFNATSITRAGSEVLTIPQNMLEACGYFCGVYIGVYHTAQSGTAAESVSEFTIVVGSRIMQLSEGQTVTDFVGEKAYRYYSFEATCDDCTVTFSLSAISAGDPDLYVCKGRHILPSPENADFRSSTIHGDFLQISPDNHFFSTGRPLRGPYSIGVFGFQNCTYTLTVTTSISAVQQLAIGTPVRREQAAGKIAYFAFYSWRKENILVSLGMHSGRAEIRANSVKDLREVDVMSKLPASEGRSMWSSARSSTVNSLKIHKEDPEFLEGGVYLIAVETLEPSNYDVTVEYAMASDYTYLRASEGLRIHVRMNEVRRLAFVAASHYRITVRVNKFYGSVRGSVAIEPNGNPIWPFADGLTIQPSDPHFRLGTYYITLLGLAESELSITVTNGNDAVRLTEGLPQNGEIVNDEPAYFLYTVPTVGMPAGTERRLSVFVKFADPVVDPVVYVRHVSRYDSRMPSPALYDVKLQWDNELKQLGGIVPMESVFNSSVAFGVFVQAGHSFSARFDVVAWSTGIVFIVPEHSYTRGLNSAGEMNVFEVSVQQVSRLYIEVVPCVGEVEFYVTKTLASLDNRRYDLKKVELNKGRLFGSLEAPVGVYYISVRALTPGAQYTIRTIVSDAREVAELEDMYLGSYGNIEYSVDGDSLTLRWSQVYKKTPLGAEVEGISYGVYVSEDGAINMHTVCGIRYGSSRRLGETSGTSLSYPLSSLRSDRKLAFNVIATTSAPGAGESKNQYSLAYNPLYLQVPKAQRASRVLIGTFAN